MASEIKVNVFCKTILSKNGKILLLKRRMSDTTRPGKWDLPGGGLHWGEDLTLAVKREVFEETGIKGIEPKLFFGKSFIYYGGFALPLIYCAKSKTREVTLSEEHTEFSWVPLKEALKKDFGKEGKWLAEALREFGKTCDCFKK
jgi:8-oxo-dGTP diphosphatase